MSSPISDALLDFKQFDYLLVADVEATCWESNEGRVHEMETLEFAGAVVRTSNLEILETFSIIIRPQVNPTLSDYCRSLTGITQAAADSGINFEQLGEMIAKRLEPYRRLIAWASWGNYDRRQLEQDAMRWKTTTPLHEISHINLKKAFAKKRRIKGTRPSIRRALDIVGLPYEGVAHSGIDDVRNIVRLLPYLTD